MTTMTEILAAHVYNFTFMICQCRVDEHSKTMDTYEHAAHVAAALETAGFGQVEGEKEWGVLWEEFGSFPDWTAKYDSEEQAREKLTGSAFPGQIVSRTVTAWKKEA